MDDTESKREVSAPNLVAGILRESEKYDDEQVASLLETLCHPGRKTSLSPMYQSGYYVFWLMHSFSGILQQPLLTRIVETLAAMRSWRIWPTRSL
jgi:hypothetical protein